MAQDKFYKSKEWYKLRARVIAAWQQHDLPCSYCGQAIAWGHPSGKAIVDHIIPRRDRPDLELDPANLTVLHHSCHTRKTVRRDYNKGVESEPVGNDGFPLNGDWS